MKKLSLIILCLMGVTMSFSQEVTFRPSDQKILVTKGTVVTITADTAYVISKERAAALNEKLDELKNAALLNQDLKEINTALLEKVKEVDKLVEKLLKQMEQDGEATDVSFDRILEQLDEGLDRLRANNERLEDTNQQLKAQIDELNHTISKLKKEIRGIWWNGIADKLVAGGIGLAIGMLLVAL